MASKDGQLKIAVAGAAGRMGQTVVRVASADAKVRVTGGFERPGHPAVGRDIGEMAGVGSLGVPLLVSARDAMEDADELIDFTSPEVLAQNLENAKSLKKNMVIGTTGLDDACFRMVKAFSRQQACVMSSNFSVGINLLWKLAVMAAKAAGPEYDIEIVDMHHHFKKDAPSGTALTMAAKLAKALGTTVEKSAVYGRHTRQGTRRQGEIGMHALRAGDVVGDHTVYLAGPGERLELTHRAHSRENFAAGALKAAWWLKDGARKKGLFSMRDVLGLR